MKYLQTREYYEDIYDKGTVEQCRFLHHHKLEVTDKDIEAAKLTEAERKGVQEVKGLWFGVVQEMSAFLAAAERFNKKEAAIAAMMQEDTNKDHTMAFAQLPANAQCRKCTARDLRVISKDLHDWGEHKADRVLFMVKCNKCSTNSAFYDDGEQWVVEPTRCPECHTEKVTYVKDKTQEAITFTYTCERCDHVWQDILELGYKSSKAEVGDPTYEDDRKLFCYSKKVRSWAEDIKNNPIRTSSRPSWEENETEKLYKAELAKIEMLTVAQVNKRLARVLAANDYTDLQLGAPNMEKELNVLFTAIDTQVGRSPDNSSRTCWKLVSKALDNSNWRLVRSSLEYRSGYIKGKLRAYENKHELEQLINRRLKIMTKKS